MAYFALKDQGTIQDCLSFCSIFEVFIPIFHGFFLKSLLTNQSSVQGTLIRDYLITEDKVNFINTINTALSILSIDSFFRFRSLQKGSRRELWETSIRLRH